MGYKDIIIPEGKDPKEYTSKERRAEILKLVLEKGHPDAISKTALARRYDVSNPCITYDFKFIAKDVAETLGTDADLITEVVYHKALKKCVASEKPEDLFRAARILHMYNEWLFNSGRKKRAATSLEVRSHNVVTWEEIKQKYDTIKTKPIP